MKENVSSAVNALHRVLREIGWASEADTPATSFRVDLGAPHVPVSDVLVAIDPVAECFIVLANFAPPVPMDRREAVGRFLLQVNWDLLTGSFEMDAEGGRVRLRVSADFADAELSEKSIRRAILTVMELVEKYAGPLSKLTGEAADTNGPKSMRKESMPGLHRVSGPGFAPLDFRQLRTRLTDQWKRSVPNQHRQPPQEPPHRSGQPSA